MGALPADRGGAGGAPAKTHIDGVGSWEQGSSGSALRASPPALSPPRPPASERPSPSEVLILRAGLMPAQAVPNLCEGDMPFAFAFFSTLQPHCRIAPHTAPCNLRGTPAAPPASAAPADGLSGRPLPRQHHPAAPSTLPHHASPRHTFASARAPAPAGARARSVRHTRGG